MIDNDKGGKEEGEFVLEAAMILLRAIGTVVGCYNHRITIPSLGMTGLM